MRGTESLRDESIEGLAHYFGLGATEYLFGGFIKEHDALVFIDRNDGVHCRADDPSQLRFISFDRFFDKYALGNVADERQDVMAAAYHARLEPSLRFVKR